MSGDPNLIEAFRQGEDIHARTAEQVFGERSGLSESEAAATGEDHQLQYHLREDSLYLGKGVWRSHS